MYADVLGNLFPPQKCPIASRTASHMEVVVPFGHITCVPSGAALGKIVWVAEKLPQEQSHSH